MTVEEQLRAYGRSIEQRRIPITADEAMNDETAMFDDAGDDDVGRRAAEPNSHSSGQRRTGVWLAAAACMVVLVAGLAVVIGSNDDTLVPSDDTVPTSPAPETTSTTAAPGTTANPVVDAESEATVEPEPEPSGSPAVLGEPVSGQTQQTVVGDIAWTLVEGDSSTLPTRVSAQIDGTFYAADERGTWRSADGSSWELTDLDRSWVSGDFEFEFGGETWARLNTSDGLGLGRWDGETFSPVELPESTVPDVAGLQASSWSSPPPVELGNQLVVPVWTSLYIPFTELAGFDVPTEGPPDAYHEWDSVTETIRFYDWESDDLLPVALEIEPFQGDPGRLEVRDVDTGETLTTVETLPGMDTDEFLMRLVGQNSIEYHDFLIGDGDGFEIVDAPWDFADGVRVTALNGRLLSVVSYYDPGSDRAEWELWESSDARTWTPLELPTPVGSQIDIVGIASDGSLALLTIISRDGQGQPTERWSSVDGSTWTPVDAGGDFSFPEYTDIGWLRTVGREEGGISVSADGLVWQDIPFDVRPSFEAGGGGGEMVVGQTIFITEYENGGDHTMWVGRVDDG